MITWTSRTAPGPTPDPDPRPTGPHTRSAEPAGFRDRFERQRAQGTRHLLRPGDQLARGTVVTVTGQSGSWYAHLLPGLYRLHDRGYLKVSEGEAVRPTRWYRHGAGQQFAQRALRPRHLLQLHRLAGQRGQGVAAEPVGRVVRHLLQWSDRLHLQQLCQAGQQRPRSRARSGRSSPKPSPSTAPCALGGPGGESRWADPQQSLGWQSHLPGLRSRRQHGRGARVRPGRPSTWLWASWSRRTWRTAARLWY